jgi:cytochrome c peroxidase
MIQPIRCNKLKRGSSGTKYRGTGDPTKERNSHGRGTNFDTPSLRALWLTAPYFHDGSASSLADVLRYGNEHNLAARLSAGELDDLVAFLRALP